jgi:cell division protein FtsQ
MRRVGRLAFRARAIVRHPPAPRWLAGLRRAGLIIGLILIMAAGGGALIQSGAGDSAVRAARQALEEASIAAGLMINEAYSEGRSATSPAAIAEALEPFIGRGTLLLDTELVRRRVEELPWVRSASAAKLLPGTLLVRIVEHEPVALWHDGERTRLVAADGTLLPITDLRPYVELKLLHGKGAPEAAGELVALLATEPDLARRISAASRIGERRWNLYLEGRIEVRLPATGVEQAWRRLAELERQGELSGRAIAAVDLRGPAWTAIRLKGDPKDLIAGRGA